MNTSIARAEAVTTDGCRVQYRIEGRANAPALLLCHAAGSNLTLWDEQMPALRERFRVVRYDSRGQGASDVPTGPYTIDRLAADALSVLDAAGIARASFCGISIGGMVGQTLATQAPVRLERLIIANSAPTGGSPETWNARIAAVTENGMGPIVDSVLERWLTPEFRARNPAAVARVRAMLEASPRPATPDAVPRSATSTRAPPSVRLLCRRSSLWATATPRRRRLPASRSPR